MCYPKENKSCYSQPESCDLSATLQVPFQKELSMPNKTVSVLLSEECD